MSARDTLRPKPTDKDAARAAFCFNEIFQFRCKAQRDFVMGSSRRYQMWVASRGAGKSWALALKILWLSIVNGSQVREEGTYKTILVLGRTADECLTRIMPLLDEHLGKWRGATGIPLVGSYSAGRATYRLNNGVQVVFRSWGLANRLANLRGYNACSILVDEVAHAQVSGEQLLHTVGPALRGDHPEMVFGAVTSPNGPRGLVGHFLRMAQEDHADYWMTWSTVHDIGLSDAEIATLRSGVTELMWRQEYLAEILTPSHVCYPQYSETGEASNVRPFHRSPGLSWSLSVDWGENYGAAIVVAHHRDGTWDVVDEVLSVEGRLGQRRDIIRIVDKWTRRFGKGPLTICGDRAIPTENAWLYSKLGNGLRWFLSCNTKQEQSRAWGIPFVQFMLQPLEGQIRLYLSDKLQVGKTDQPALGLRDALATYSYEKFRDRQTGEMVIGQHPESNTAPTHTADCLRMLVVTTRMLAECHGGQTLPLALDHDVDLAA
ncbi:MAG: hypothetical protein ACI9MR_000022 [Myxococcota bacterium]